MTQDSGTIGKLGDLADGRRWLLVVAAQIEADAIAAGLGGRAPAAMWRITRVGDRFDMVVSGVGKANAAGATALGLDPAQHGGVISIGVGGGLLDEHGQPLAPILSTVVGTSSLFADEGIERDEGWATIASLGFPPTVGLNAEPENGVHCSAALVERLGTVVDCRGPIATISTCSATDASAHAARARTGAIVEAMEGAAVGLAARRTWLARGGTGACPFVELRTVSNLTGSTGAAWDLQGALARLGGLVQVL